MRKTPFVIYVNRATLKVPKRFEIPRLLYSTSNIYKTKLREFLFGISVREE